MNGFDAKLLGMIALGSATGGVARFVLGSVIQARSAGAFPTGTLLINISGSLLLGFLMRYTLGSTSVSPEVRAMLTTGFCGGYTTFSTFSYETLTLIEDGDWRRAGGYATASVVLALLGTLGGFALARAALDARRAL
ncbi:MAG: fluoride efflux transporter CrcB [Gemmatimonadetes bacterium]|nr:fluoride efflux transporter CrcB [Gemmatimonadota bacterium]